MAKEEKKLSVEEALAEKKKLLEAELMALNAEKAKIEAEKRERAAAEAEKARLARIEAEKRLAAEWQPICRVSGVYDYNDEREAYTESMVSGVLRQHKKTGKVEFFVE